MCPLGTYQPKFRETECLPCPSGTTTAQKGSSSVKDCQWATGKEIILLIHLFVSLRSKLFSPREKKPNTHSFSRNSVCSKSSLRYTKDLRRLLSNQRIALTLTHSSRPNSHYAVEIWKRSFLSPIRPTFHANRSRKWSFSKTSSNRRDLKAPALCFLAWTDNILKTELFENRNVTIFM